MSGFFQPRPQGDSWFRIGRLEMTSTLVVVLVGFAGMLVSVFAPTLPMRLAFLPAGVMRGEFWRIVTWPLAEFVSLWSILTLVILWYFGTQLEATVGRNRMASLYVGIWAALTAATALIGLFAPTAVGLVGVSMIELAILLLWIGEYPTRRFFLAIPAWVVGAVLLGLQVLMLLAGRAWGSLLALLLGLVGVAIVARRLGLLSAQTWIPGARSRQRSRTRSAPLGPAHGRRHRVSDEARMDELLGKISAEGIHSLTKSERAELEKLRQRRQR